MKKFVVISKANCARCRQFKDWLAQYDLSFEEWSVDSPEISKKLLNDQKFLDQAIRKENKVDFIANSGDPANHWCWILSFLAGQK